MSTKTSGDAATSHSAPKRAPGEGVAAEPTIIAEQHRKPDIGPKSVPKESTPVAPSQKSGKSGKE